MEYWNVLPEHFKKSVVKKLDYKSRCRLRRCSESDQQLVDSCPVFLESVEFLACRDGRVQLSIGRVYFLRDGSVDPTTTCRKTYEMDAVVQDFLTIFNHPKSKLGQLKIQKAKLQQDPSGINELISKLLSKIHSETFKLKIEELIIINFCFIEETNFLKFVQKLDSSTLKSLTLRKATAQTMNILIETEHWKNLKKIEMVTKTEIPIEKFLHADSFHVQYESLSGREIWMCIKKYLSKVTQVHSIFYLSTIQKLELNEIFQYFNVPARNEPLQPNILNEFLRHTQRFQLPWSSEHFLVVQFTDRLITGVICRKDCLLDDFEIAEDL